MNLAQKFLLHWDSRTLPGRESPSTFSTKVLALALDKHVKCSRLDLPQRALYSFSDGSAVATYGRGATHRAVEARQFDLRAFEQERKYAL